MRLMTRFSLILAAAVSFCGMARGAESDPKITLIDAGQGAKSELRYDLPVDTAQKGTMSTKMSMRQSMGGMNMPSQAMPEMRTPVTIQILEKLDDGYRFQAEMHEMEIVDKGEMPAQQIDMMRKMMAQIAGTTAKGILSDLGYQKDIEVELPSGLNPMIQQQADQSVGSMKQITMPLPAEAVGEGAKWTVEQDFDEGGMKMKQTATCVLKERKGNIVVIEIEMKQSADPQTISNPQMPQADMELKKFEGSGTATVKLDLTRVWPVESRIRSKVNMTMSLDMMGQVQEFEQTIESEATVESEEPTKITTTP